MAQMLSSMPLATGLAATDLMAMSLWVASLALGGNLSHEQVVDVAGGTQLLSPHEFDVLAQVLNEWHLDHGGNHPVPYAHGLPPA